MTTDEKNFGAHTPSDMPELPKTPDSDPALNHQNLEEASAPSKSSLAETEKSASDPEQPLTAQTTDTAQAAGTGQAEDSDQTMTPASGEKKAGFWKTKKHSDEPVKSQEKDLPAKDERKEKKYPKKAEETSAPKIRPEKKKDKPKKAGDKPKKNGSDEESFADVFKRHYAMTKDENSSHRKKMIASFIILGVLCVLLIASLITIPVLGVNLYTLQEEKASLQGELASVQSDLSDANSRNEELEFGPARLLLDAKALMGEENYEEAKNTLEDLIEQNPSTAEAEEAQDLIEECDDRIQEREDSLSRQSSERQSEQSEVGCPLNAVDD